MTDSERDKKIMQIAEDLSEIKTKVTADYRALYGNGHPGILAEHETLKNAVIKLTAEQSPTNAALGARIVELEKVNASDKSGRNALYAVGSAIIAIISAVAALFGIFNKQ